MKINEIKLMIETRPTEAVAYVLKLQEEIDTLKEQRNQALVIIAKFLDSIQEFLPDNCDG